jgi:hypothetical protein
MSLRAGIAAPLTAGAEAASHIEVVRAHLPNELRPHVVNYLIRPGELVLFAETAAWATRLRLAACEAAAAGAFTALPGIAAPPRITVRVTPQRARR